MAPEVRGGCVRYVPQPIADFAALLCRKASERDLIWIEAEAEGAGRILETRCFSGRDPSEIARFARDQDAAGRAVFARIGDLLSKGVGGERSPFGGTRSARPAPPKPAAPPPPPKPESFLKSRGFA